MVMCSIKGEPCRYANNYGQCELTGCVANPPLTKIDNLATPIKMEDGIYMQVFAVKDGVRYDMHVINSRDLSNTLVNSLMDGIGKIITKG